MYSQKVVYNLILVNTAFIYVSKGFNSATWWVSVLSALLNSMGYYSALHRAFLTLRVVWMASYVIPSMFIWLMACSSERCERGFSVTSVLSPCTHRSSWKQTTAFGFIWKEGLGLERFLFLPLLMVWCLTGNLMVINDSRWGYKTEIQVPRARQACLFTDVIF